MVKIMFEKLSRPIYDASKNRRAAFLSLLAAIACLAAIPVISGCGKQAFGLGVQTGKESPAKVTGSTVNGIAIPIGTEQAWEISIRYELDASKAAREFGGKALLTQPVPPSLSQGTSSNQEIKASLTCDGRAAKIGKDSLGDSILLLEVDSNSGTAILEFKGVVFNRNMRSVKDGGETLSASKRKKFTRPYFVNHEAPAFKQFLKKNGLNRDSDQSTGEYVDKILVWLAQNRTYGHDGDGKELNEALLVKPGTIDCNLSSALVAAILRANGVPVQIKTRVLAKFNGKWDFHADIAYFNKEERKWEGVSPADIISGTRDDVLAKGTAVGSNGLGLDFSPGYESVMVDTANDVDRIYDFKGWAGVGLDYNTQSPWAHGRQQGQVGDVDFKLTHKITPLKIN